MWGECLLVEELWVEELWVEELFAEDLKVERDGYKKERSFGLFYSRRTNRIPEHMTVMFLRFELVLRGWTYYTVLGKVSGNSHL